MVLRGREELMRVNTSPGWKEVVKLWKQLDLKLKLKES